MDEKDIQRILYKNLVGRKNRANIAIPNAYLFGKHESDFTIITRYGFAYEYEIKLSYQDFLNDFNKSKHDVFRSYYKSPSLADIPKRFYFVTHGFWLNARDLPDYAGFIVITENGIMKTVRRAPDLPAKKIDNKKLVKICTSLSYRLWDRW